MANPGLTENWVALKEVDPEMVDISSAPDITHPFLDVDIFG
jgi:hypothetical protein